MIFFRIKVGGCFDATFGILILAYHAIDNSSSSQTVSTVPTKCSWKLLQSCHLFVLGVFQEDCTNLRYALFVYGVCCSAPHCMCCSWEPIEWVNSLGNFCMQC